MQAAPILSQHSSVYQIVTEQIIRQLEAGVAPWHKPWTHATTTESRQWSEIPRNKRIPARRLWVRLALLADLQAGQRPWRPRPQRPARDKGRLLEDRNTASGRRGWRDHREKVCPAALLHRL